MGEKEKALDMIGVVRSWPKNLKYQSFVFVEL